MLTRGTTAFAQEEPDPQEQDLEVLRLYYPDDYDKLIATATRFPKPKGRIAENITVIDKKEIEEMNAHTLGDVLYGVTGVQTEANSGVGAEIFTMIQGSSYYHALVMIDGVHLNHEAFNAQFGIIPVQNIERIEIIKGPASSAWGSSLGGVINIITKDASVRKISGTLAASYGGMNTGDSRAEVSGRKDNFTWYLYGGNLVTDGADQGLRYYADNLYAKFGYDATPQLNLALTAGYTRGHQGMGEFPEWDETDRLAHNYLFTTLSADYDIGPDTKLKLSLRALRQNALWQYLALSTGEIFGDYRYNVRTEGGSAIFSSRQGAHSFVIGSDFDDITSISNVNTPEKLNIKKYAVFANDSFSLGRLGITAGLRYDHTTITGDFVSPSLGITYRLTDRTLLRATVSRGFNSPGVELYASTAYYHANPALKHEQVWSVQAGLETTAVKYLLLKAAVFRHRISDAFQDIDYEDGTFTTINAARQRREGFELELKTLPVYNTSLFAGVCYVTGKDLDTGEKISSVDYTYDIGLRYSDEKSFTALLKGRYIHWNPAAYYSSRIGFIMDMNLSKKIYIGEKRAMEVFLTGHNIFDAVQHSSMYYSMPNRWFEDGGCMEKATDGKEEIIVLDSGIGEDFYNNMACCKGKPSATGA